jgi:hypothetical protein
VFRVLGRIREPVDLSPRETLDSAAALMARQGYTITERTETHVTAVRRRREGLFGHSLLDLTVVAQPLPKGGVEIELRGSDREGLRDRQAEWSAWTTSLPKQEANQRKQRSKDPQAPGKRTRDQESSGARGTPVAPQGTAEHDEEPVPRGAPERKPSDGDAGGERGDAPAVEARGWSSVAPWNQEPRVAASKRATGPTPPQDRSRNTRDDSSGAVPQHEETRAQKEKVRDDYRTLLGQYSDGIDLLERLYGSECQHAYVAAHRPDVKQEYEGIRTRAHEQIEDLLEDMNKLEKRIPDFAQSGLAFRRNELDTRRRRIEREAEKRRRAAGPPKPSEDQMKEDRQNYRKLLGLYPQYLDAVEETYTIDQSTPIVQRRVKRARQTAVKGIHDVRRKLDKLEERTPSVATGTGSERARLENRWKELQGRDARTSI